MGFEFPFNLIGKSTQSLAGTQIEAKNWDFCAVSQTDLTRGVVSSEADAGYLVFLTLFAKSAILHVHFCSLPWIILLATCLPALLLSFFSFLVVYEGTDLPELQEDSHPIKDVGLRGEVITGEDTESENDLIRYSNYMSGAGSTFGGFMAELPEDINDITTGTKKP